MATKPKAITPMPKSEQVSAENMTTDYAALDKAHLAIAIARELGWRIEPIIVKTVKVVEADRPLDAHDLPIRNFSQYEIFDPDGQRQARGIAEHDIAVFLPEWLDKTDVALTLPLVATKWQINTSAGFPIAYVVDDDGVVFGSGSGTRIAKALCLAWLESRKHEHAI